MTTFGEVPWGQENSNKKFEDKKEDLWLHCQDGDNYLRVVTQAFQYASHKLKVPGDKGFGKKVYCSAANGSCPLCEDVKNGVEGVEKKKDRWLLGVISRIDNTYKILDVGWSVYNDINKLAKNVQYWGDPSKYDINLLVNKKADPNDYYTVQPLGKSPLSVEDQNIVDNIDLDELKRKVTPPSAEDVAKRVAKLLGTDNAGAKTPAQKPAAKKVEAKVESKTESKTDTTKVDMSDDTEDEKFPDFDAQ